jgi:hypothetical protein
MIQTGLARSVQYHERQLQEGGEPKNADAWKQEIGGELQSTGGEDAAQVHGR